MTVAPDLHITDRPWSGRCATTGCTLAEFADALQGVDAPSWVTRAAVSLCRSYATCLQPSGHPESVREVVQLIEDHRLGRATTSPDLMAAYAAAEKLEFDPQWPDEAPWVREVAVAICERWTIRGLCDPLYIANVIHGEEIDADHPGDRHERRI